MGCAASTEVAPAEPVSDELAAANTTTAASGQVSTTDGTPVAQGGLLRVAKSADSSAAIPSNTNPAVAADSSIPKWNGVSPAVIRAAAAHGATAVCSCLTSAGRVSQQEALTWAAELDAKSTNAWLAALQVAIDALWYPLITSVEAALQHDGKSAVGVRRPTWESLTAAEMLKLLRSTGDCMCGQSGEQSSSWAYADSCRELLALIDAIWQQRLLASVDGSRVDEVPFVNANLQRMLSMLGIALCRMVAVEDVSTFSAKLHMWASVQRDYGLERPRLCAALDAPSKALLLYADTVSVADSKLKLEVSRPLALWDAWPQWRSSACCSLARGRSGSVKLYPRFRLSNGRLEAGEGHGPRKELFAMFGQQMLFGAAKETAAGAKAGAANNDTLAGKGAPAFAAATTPLFPYRKEARVHWFDAAEKRSEERESLYHFAGWLLAQSVCNRSPLGVALPPLLFAKLLTADGFKPSLCALEAFDASAAAGVRAIHKLSIEEFESLANAEVEEGQRPPTREEYEASALKQLMVDAVSWQFDALKTGFEAVFPPEALRPLGFSAEQLAVAVCGPADDDADFDLRSTFRIIEDEEIASCPALQSALWEVLDSWSSKDKRTFSQFVTGSERRPAAWTEVISIQMPFELDAADAKSATHMLGTLPQAHTCDNMLELPNYLAALCALRGVDYASVKTQGSLTGEEQAKGGKNAKKGATTPAGSSDLSAELKRVIDERFRMAVSCCAQYDLDETADPPPPSDFPPFPLEKQHSKTVGSSLNLAPNARTPRGPTGVASALVAAPAAVPPSQSFAPAEPLNGKRPSRVPSAARVPAVTEGQNVEEDAITSFRNSSRASTHNSRQGSARVSRQRHGRISSLIVADMDADGDVDDRQEGLHNGVGGCGVDDGSWVLNKGPTVTRYVTARPAAAAAPKSTSRPISREVKGIPSLDEDSFANTATGDNIDSDTDMGHALAQSGKRSRPGFELDKTQDVGADLHNLNEATHAPASADPFELEEFE